MLKRFYVTIGLLLAAAWLAWWLWPDRNGTNQPPPSGAKAAPAAAPPGATTPVATNPALVFPLNSPDHDIRADLRLVSETVETFRSNFPQDGNPSGTNAEITAALTGKNKLRFAFIPSTHPAINREGELCDRWGTPFFFHAESATRMELRSAGPDRTMWTNDDETHTP